MLEEIFCAYDVRGRYPGEVNKEIAEQIAYACGRAMRGSFVVARDVRRGSTVLLEAVVQGLRRAKVRRIANIGLATTPMFYFLVNTKRAAGGIMVTASHNPKEWNGLKVVGRGALMVGGYAVLELMKQYPFRLNGGCAEEAQCNSLHKKIEAKKEYCEFLGSFADVRKKLRVVFDCSNGATGMLIPSLTIKNIEAYLINQKIDGNFPAHGPDPTAPYATDDARKAVKRFKADLGVIFDGDGDRAVFIDDRGRNIPSFIILYLLSLFSDPPFVGDMMVHQSIKTAFPEMKNKVYASRVGTRFLKEIMQKKNTRIGAERSGHYYFRDFFKNESAILAAIKVMDALSRLPYRLSDFLDLVPEMHEDYFNMEVKDPKKIIRRIEKRWSKEAKYKGKKDGLLLEFEEGWFIVRPSNTEPLLRFFVGAKTEAGKKRLVKKLRAW